MIKRFLTITLALLALPLSAAAALPSTASQQIQIEFLDVDLTSDFAVLATVDASRSTEIMTAHAEKTHQGLPIHGYRDQTDGAVSLVQVNKEIEEALLRHLDALAASDEIDRRWLAVGRTHIEQGFMSVNRAVFQPGRAVLPCDKTDQNTA